VAFASNSNISVPRVCLDIIQLLSFVRNPTREFPGASCVLSKVVLSNFIRLFLNRRRGAAGVWSNWGALGDFFECNRMLS
jgi:hypothetical protein